jgi:hypothetical protein
VDCWADCNDLSDEIVIWNVSAWFVNRVELSKISMADDGFADGMAWRKLWRGREVRVHHRNSSVVIL